MLRSRFIGWLCISKLEKVFTTFLQLTFDVTKCLLLLHSKTSILAIIYHFNFILKRYLEMTFGELHSLEIAGVYLAKSRQINQINDDGVFANNRDILSYLSERMLMGLLKWKVYFKTDLEPFISNYCHH